jgi:glycosyltransferase involved in cell wall biosynthesis
MRKRLLFVVNDSGFFVSHRLPLALGARDGGFEVHVASAPGDGVAAIESHGIQHHRLGLSRSGINPLREALTFLEILSLMRRLGPDLVHLVTSKPVIYGGIAARLLGVRGVVAAISGLGHVFTAHDLRTRAIRSLVTMAYRVALTRDDLTVIFQNSSDRDLLTRAGAVALDKTLLVRGSGVDLRVYKALPEPDGIPVVTFAARLLRAKGVFEFVAAAKRLHARGVQCRFLLAGDADPGNIASVTEDEIAQWRADGTVEVLGHRRDIAELFAASNLVVLPSYYGEGVPKVLVEAAACGRAVVTTDMPGCRDAVEPGETALLVPPRDAVALAQAVGELLADRERRHRMGVAGRALAEREYGVERIVATHLDVYRSLIHV